MQHKEFAERVAGRLKAVAAAAENEKGNVGRGAISRANELRVAAHIVRDLAEAATRAENRHLERGREDKACSALDHTNEVLENEKETALL